MIHPLPGRWLRKSHSFAAIFFLATGMAAVPCAMAQTAAPVVAAPTASEPASIRVQTGHTQGAVAAFSPDGLTLVSASGDKFLKFWDVASGREFRTLAIGTRFGLRAVRYSPDGKMLAVIEPSHGQGGINVWNASTGVLLKRLTGHAGGTDSIAFSADSLRLLSAGGDDTARVWDLQTGNELQALKHTGFKSRINVAVWSPDGQTIATGRADNSISLWDVASGRVLRVLRGHQGGINALVFTADGQQLISASSDKSLRFWNVADGSPLRQWAGTEEDLGLRSLSLSRDGQRLLSSSFGEARMWDVARGTMLFKIKDGREPVFSPDGKILVTGSAAGSLKNLQLWSADTGALVRSLEASAVAGYRLRYAPDGRSVAALYGDHSNAVWQWQLRSGKMSTGFSGLAAAPAPERTGTAARKNADARMPHDVTFAGDSLNVTTSSGEFDAVIRVEDPLSTEPLAIIDTRKLKRASAGPEDGNGVAISASPDGQMLALVPKGILSLIPGKPASRSPDGPVNLWSVTQGRIMQTLALEGAMLQDVGFSPDGRMAATLTDRDLRVWEVGNGKLLRSFPASKNTYRFAFSGDGRRIAALGQDNRVRVWDVAGGQELASLAAHDDDSAALALNRDGSLLAYRGADQLSVQIFEVATGASRQVLKGHQHWVEDVAFSPDGRTLASISADKTLRIWQLESGSELASLIHLGARGWLAITPEGYFNASGFAAADAVNVVQGREVRGVAEFWDVFFRPDLLVRKLAGEDIAVDTRGVTFDTAMRSPPPRDISLSLDPATTTTQASVKLRLRIADAGGGLGEVRIFNNGKLIASDGLYKDAAPASARGATDAGARLLRPAAERLCKPSANERSGKSCSGEIAVDVIPGEDNEFSVIAFNGENSIQSLPARLEFKSSLARRAPHLWILAIGINEFSPAQTAFGKLGNAVKDAQDFARVFAARAASRFDPAHIHLVGTGEQGSQLLTDQAATREAMLGLLDQVVRKANPEDSFVWFVASHGTTDRDGVFGIVPHDIACKGERCADKTGLLSSNDILDKSKAIKAMNQLFIFDTCQSGALDNRISGLYDARVATLAKNMGLHLYASAQATEHASDSDGKGNGLFTGQLLAGLNGSSADRNRDQLITITELGEFARQQTVSLSGPDAARRGATAHGVVGKISRPVSQTPLIMHFGRDAVLSRVVAP